MFTKRIPIEERFWAKVDKGGPDECWLWIGARNWLGYGQIGTTGNRHISAHRCAYELLVGPIPPGFHVLHRCDNPPCVNPAHLWVGTNADNVADRQAKGRSSGNRGPRQPQGFTRINAAKTHCPSGHPYSGDNLRIDSGGARRCRECASAWQRAYMARKRAGT